jgi:hypothetical protein
MLRAHTILLVALFLAAVLASPVRTRQKRSFKIKRVEQLNYVPDGKAAYRRALFKFGFDDIEFQPQGEIANMIQASSAAQLNSTGNEDGETTASPTQNDAQFLSPVNIGGQTFIMNFDSGSSDAYDDPLFYTRYV